MTRKSRFIGLAVLSLFAGATQVAAAREKTPVESPAAINALTACREIAESTQRLSCYDSAVGTLKAAIAANDVYIVDKSSVRKARSSLFGLRLPSLGLFAEDTTDTNAVTELGGEIAAAVQEGYGNWRLTLRDGSVWAQTDDVSLGTSPRPADPVLIKRGLMASYKMSIKGRPSFRVRRIS
jgi:hypothetical protein